MPSAICLGEALIDFVALEKGVSLMEASGFEKKPGGAPANVAAGLARLGISVGFLGKVGDDPFGRFLADVLRDAGVDVSHLLFEASARTGLAFVALSPTGVPEFTFFRHPSADMLLRPEEIREDYFEGIKVFHFGSITLISQPSRWATMRAVEVAQRGGALISYDPNLRLSLWPSEEDARRGMSEALHLTDICKVSQEEVLFLTGQGEADGAGALQARGPSLVAVTRGPGGCALYNRQAAVEAPGHRVKVLDTTGAGDAFVAAMLFSLLELGLARADLPRLEREQLQRVAAFANAAGALATTVRGAIPSLPTKRQVEAFLKQAGAA